MSNESNLKEFEERIKINVYRVPPLILLYT